MAKDYYATLGVSKSASADEIKSAFRKLAHQHHPDKGGKEEKFKEINEAYQALGDADKRKQYDQFGSAAFDGSGGGNPFAGGGAGFQGFDPSMFGDLGSMFGDMFGGGGGGGRQKGQDLAVQVTLTFKEAIFGVEKEITLNKSFNCERCGGVGAEPGTSLKKCSTCNGQGHVIGQQRTVFGTIQTRNACSACHGRGEVPEKACTACSGKGVQHGKKSVRVEIPAGVDNGMQIRVRGQGEVLGAAGEPGDLYLQVHVQSDARFVREGENIYVTRLVGFTQAALGCEVEVDTVDGKVSMKIPAGTQSGEELRLRGKGVPHGRGRGDEIVTIQVVTPKKLDKEQRKLLEELALSEK
ncbi:TPA: molecular chaperone DnaJ [Candidatus Uhrbacteria bacterium]|nr:molecular chaperone DnaJ [Candidatus Uhrbacteria bacterium]